MSTETIEKLLRPFWRTDDGLSPMERAEAYGIDLSLLDESLKLTPEQRMDQHQAALELAAALRQESP